MENKFSSSPHLRRKSCEAQKTELQLTIGRSILRWGKSHHQIRTEYAGLPFLTTTNKPKIPNSGPTSHVFFALLSAWERRNGGTTQKSENR